MARGRCSEGFGQGKWNKTSHRTVMRQNECGNGASCYWWGNKRLFLTNFQLILLTTFQLILLANFQLTKQDEWIGACMVIDYRIYKRSKQALFCSIAMNGKQKLTFCQSNDNIDRTTKLSLRVPMLSMETQWMNYSAIANVTHRRELKFHELAMATQSKGIIHNFKFLSPNVYCKWLEKLILNAAVTDRLQTLR